MAIWRQPVKKVKLGSLFGAVDKWHKAPGHRGTDYNGFATGEPLLAIYDGTVVVNKWSDVLGNVLVIKVGNHFFGYCHMAAPSPLKVKTAVKSGDVVGKAGNTGSASFGTHLHFTLGLTPDAVFYGKVYDAHAYIERQIKLQKQAAKAAPAAPAVVAPVVPAPTTPKKGNSVAE